MNDYNAYITYIFTLVVCVVPISLIFICGCYSITVRVLSSNDSGKCRKLRIFKVKFSVVLILFVAVFSLVLTHPAYENIKYLWFIDGSANKDMAFWWLMALLTGVFLTGFLALQLCPDDD